MTLEELRKIVERTKEYPADTKVRILAYQDQWVTLTYENLEHFGVQLSDDKPTVEITISE